MSLSADEPMDLPTYKISQLWKPLHAPGVFLLSPEMAEEERAEYGVGNAPANTLSIVELSSNSVHYQSGHGGPDAAVAGQVVWRARCGIM
jgi:hypothetical protein